MTEFSASHHPAALPALKPPPAPSRRPWPAAALALGALLTACGGGGSDGAAPPPAPVPPSAPVPPPAPTPSPSFTLSVPANKAIVWQGDEATVTVNVERANGFAEAVQLAAQELPGGVSAGAVSVPAGAASAALKLQAAPTAPHSLPTTVTVKGTAGTLSATQTMTATVRGKPGDVDTSFGGGINVIPVGLTDDSVRGVAVQSDGKVLVTGFAVPTAASGTEFFLLRTLRDGGLDASFGTGGKVYTGFNNGAASDEAQAVAVQADGKILVAGASDQGATGYDFALARYNADGSLDASFGTGGRVVTAFGPQSDKAYAVLVQPDGKILVGGESVQATTGGDFALARYNADGSLDASFGQGGKVLTPIGEFGAREAIYGLALQTVGGSTRIVAVGGEGDFRVVRYTATGQPDASFGTGGVVKTVFGGVIGAARSVVITTDNKIAIAGHADHDMAVVRLLPDGALDASFGLTDFDLPGKRIVALSSTNWDEATALVQQEDGKLLISGWVYSGNSSSGDTALVRLLANGALDHSFGEHGVKRTAVAANGKNDQGRALVLQPDSRVPTVRVIQAGEANGSDHDLVLMRHWL